MAVQVTQRYVCPMDSAVLTVWELQPYQACSANPSPHPWSIKYTGSLIPASWQLIAQCPRRGSALFQVWLKANQGKDPKGKVDDSIIIKSYTII